MHSKWLRAVWQKSWTLHIATQVRIVWVKMNKNNMLMILLQLKRYRCNMQQLDVF